MTGIRGGVLSAALNSSILELLPVPNTMKSLEERFRRFQAMRKLEGESWLKFTWLACLNHRQ